MKANLITEIKEVTFRALSIIEEEGIMSLLNAHPDITFKYEEEPDGRVLVLQSPYLIPLFKFLSFSEIPVTIIS